MGSVAVAGLLKMADAAAAYKYQTEVEVPIWDIYTESHQALVAKDEDGKSYLGAIATVTNKGTSPTPGPVQGSFVIYDAETGRYLTGWNNKTDSAVSGSTQIFSKTPYDGKLPPKIKVSSSIILLCPQGETGNLADGDTTNNVRDLYVGGVAPTTGGASSK